MVEIVENVVQVALQGLNEAIVTMNRSKRDLVTPSPDGLFGLGFGVETIENRRQFFSERVGLMEQRRMLEQST